MISNAIASERVSSVVGYALEAGNFMQTSPNLPHRIAVLAEANTANQSALNSDPIVIFSAQEAGSIFGYGSPVFNILRILKPLNTGGVGGIPIVVYPQLEVAGASAKIQTLTITGTANATGTHYVKVGGRKQIDGYSYAVNIVKDDTPTIIAAKISDAINGVLFSPVTASAALGVVTITTKWKGKTAQEVGVEMDINTQNLNVTYAVVETAAGSGLPSITPSLNKFEAAWNTIVINSYGLEATILDSLEQFNGKPSTSSPSGRFQGIVMKPFIAITGSTLEDPSSFTDSRKNELTIAIAPAPFSKGHSMEAAANMALLFARMTQDNPHLDVQELVYPDMPVPSTIGKMGTYDGRDQIVKKGCSVVELVDYAYQIKDFITTYHPTGDVDPQFRYCRNLIIDFNVRFGYYLLEMANVIGHAIAGDNDIVSAKKVVKPKQWKAILRTYADDLGTRALIADVEFMKSNIVVGISATNPGRIDTEFKYKKSGFARISSTTAVSGSNYGSI